MGEPVGEWLRQWFSLEGRVALVTGGSGDLGRALARGLLGVGATVALHGSSPATLEEASRELGAVAERLTLFPADLRQVEAALTLVERVVDRLGRLDVLVNCAGVNCRKPILAVTPEDYEEVMAVNLRAAYFVSQAAARQMIRQGGGKIIHIGSLASVLGLSEVSVYGASKAGLAQLTRAMAVEWAEHNIQVNCLVPGFFYTRLTAAPLWHDPRRRAWLLDRIPLKRPGEPDDLIGALLLLAGPASRYITGQTLVIDGGVLAGSAW